MPVCNDVENDGVVEPVLTGPICILHRDCQRILLGSKPALEVEVRHQFIARRKLPELHSLNARICPVYLYANPAADEDPDHRIQPAGLKSGMDPHNHWLAAMNRRTLDSAFIKKLNIHDAARLIAMPDLHSGMLIAKMTLRCFTLKNARVISIDNHLRLAFRLHGAFQQKQRPVCKLFDQPHIMRDEQDRYAPLAKLMKLADASVRERGVADRERFIHNQNVRVQREWQSRKQGGHTFRLNIPSPGRSRNSPIPANSSILGSAR